jgi:hypothetical protein
MNKWLDATLRKITLKLMLTLAHHGSAQLRPFR